MTRFVREMAFERPECLVALILSCAPEQSTRSHSVTIEFYDDEVSARVKRSATLKRGPRLLPTKDTIFAGILMHNLIVERGPDFADNLIDRAVQFGRSAALRQSEFRPRTETGWYPPLHTPDADSSSFFQQLEISPRDLDVAHRKTDEALSYLEEHGLIIDPAFTPEFMVLAGLVPMHFSVRTPKGEKVYKEIQINAPMWSLDITRGIKNERAYTDFEFRFRGIEIVRNAITAMATQYLESEEGVRKGKGQPILRRKASPELDA